MFKNVAVRVGLAVLFALVVGLVAQAVSAAPPGSGWPVKKGELCFLVDAGNDEWSWLRLGINNMGGTHYQVHGYAQQWDGFPTSTIQPLNGSAEMDNGEVVAVITKVEWRTTEFETFNGMMTMGADLTPNPSGDAYPGAVGGAVGIVTSCSAQVSSTCVDVFFQVPLYHDEDCDPTNDTHPGFPPS